MIFLNEYIDKILQEPAAGTTKLISGHFQVNEVSTLQKLNLKENQTVMKEMFDKNFSYKARILAQTLVIENPECSYSHFLSQRMLDCLIKNNRFQLDQYAFFEDVHLMTVNLQRVTPGVLKRIKAFIAELNELSNWSDVHLGIGCYKKPN